MGLHFYLCSFFILVTFTGISHAHEKIQWNRHYKADVRERTAREIRKNFRGGRLYYRNSEDTPDSRNMLLINNPPAEPLHELYRKGFSHLHVPDFHRRPLEPRAPRRRGNQTLDEIISGIIHLLGGDIEVNRPNSPLRFQVSKPPMRLNDRGPAHFNPYNQQGSTESFATTQEFPATENPGIQVEAPLIVTTSSSRWLFPDDTDVSRILGLLNNTENHNHSGSISETFNGSVLQPSFVMESSTSISESSSPSSNMKDEVEVTISNVKDVSNFNNTHDTMATFSVNSILSITEEMESQSIQPTSSVTFPELSNHSPNTVGYFPVHLSGSYETPTNVKSSTNHEYPSGPVTEWLPIAKLPDYSLISRRNYTSTNEPPIITEPFTFEVTVAQQMGNHSNETRLLEKPNTSLKTTNYLTNVSTRFMTSTDISIAVISTQVGVIYGRPSKPDELPLNPSGQPHIFAVDIAEVRPSKRPNSYQRPSRPAEMPNYGNSGIRPVGVPRPSGSVQRRPPIFRLPSPPKVPEVRIDTCVVGDDSTCDVQLHEHCRTEKGVSSCLCRPGFGRVVDRGICTAVVSMLLIIKVARLGDRTIDPSQLIPGSQERQRLSFEANHGISTVFTYGPLADGFRGSSVNGLYFLANRMVLNSTIHLAESEVRGSLRHHVEHAVSAAISRQSNQLGDSQLFVNGPLSALVEVEDLNECDNKDLNDCSELAVCENLFGTYQCLCKPGYKDKAPDGLRTSGRHCSACSPDYCSGRGTCFIANGQQECRCRGNYGGVRCQVDNEVVGVSVGVSVIAGIVIAITAACLYLWNRRWKQAQQKTEAAKHAGYRLQTLADHVRWGTAANTLGSTYVPADSTMQLAPPPMTPAASHMYSIPTLTMSGRHSRTHIYEEDLNPYGRINRTLQKTNDVQEAGMSYDTLSSECGSSEELGFPSVPSNSFVYHGTFTGRPVLR